MVAFVIGEELKFAKVRVVKIGRMLCGFRIDGLVSHLNLTV